MSKEIDAKTARELAKNAGPSSLVNDDEKFDSLLNDIEETAKSGHFGLNAENDDKWFTVRHAVELHKRGFDLDLIESVYDSDSFDIQIQWGDDDE